MRKFKVSALLEGFRVVEEISGASEHHVIRIMQAKYGDRARNIYATII